MTNPSALALASQLEKELGKDDVNMDIKGYLDTGYPPLNERLSGDPDLGLPYGRIVEIFGESGTGKTAFAVDMIIAAQKAGGCGGLFDHEHAFNINLAVGKGLNPAAPYFIHRKPETWEDSNSMAIRAARMIRESKVIPDSAPIVWVFDSVAAMVPQSMLYDSKGKRRDIDSLTMNDTSALSRVSSTTLKIINAEMARLNVITIYLNQVRTKIGIVWGDPTTTPGGAAFEFYATTRLQLRRKLVKEGEDKRVTGQIVTFHTKKNRMERPFQDIDLLLTFPEDGGAYFDRETSLLGLLLEQGKLTVRNAGSKGKLLVWDGNEYPLKTFIDKVRADGLFPKMVELYKAPVSAAPAASSAAETAAAALATL
jgi:protein RecA